MTTPFPDIDTLDPLPRPRRQITAARRIQEAVADYFSLRVSDLTSARRGRREARPRQIAYYLCRELTSMTYPQIGGAFGNRDHTTVMHGCRQIDKWMRDPRSYSDEVEAILVLAQDLDAKRPTLTDHTE